MKKAQKLTAILTLIAAIAAPSLFADSRHRGRTNDRYESERAITVEGRIRDIDRERNGFVIDLARSDRYTLFVPADLEVYSTVRNRESARNRERRVRSLDRGDYVRATGTLDRNGVVYVRSIQLLRDDDDRNDRDSRRLTGTVQSVDLRSGYLLLRDDRTGRVITVKVRRTERDDARRDLDDLRRGDHVTITGDLQRNGQFEADRIDRAGWR